MDGEDNPGIMIDNPEMIWCGEHLEPWREHWPLGYLPASMCLLNQALEDDEIIAASGGRVEALSATIREYGPLCCRYSGILPELRELILTDDKDVENVRFKEIMRKYSFPPPDGWKD